MYHIENTTARIPARRSREYTTLMNLAQLRTGVAEALGSKAEFAYSYIADYEPNNLSIVSNLGLHAAVNLRIRTSKKLNKVSFEHDVADKSAVESIASSFGDALALEAKEWVRRGNRLPHKHVNTVAHLFMHVMCDEPFVDFIEVTPTAIESGMACRNWSNNEALLDRLGRLMDIKASQGLPGLGMLLGKICANRAFKVYLNSLTTTHQGKHVKLVHRCHIEDSRTQTLLCLHFAQDPHSNKLIIGLAEEIPLSA
jgi:hypothetical protein